MLLLLAAVDVFFSSCGQTTNERQVKEYSLAISGASYDLLPTFRQLVKEFNQQAGSEYLKFSEETGSADSLIVLTDNLQARDGKVGWGQWITQDSERKKVKGFKIETDRTTDYAMRLEFDLEYFKKRMTATAGSIEHYELQKLFFHEVGHGLQMPHDPDQSNVMYYEISGHKDFDGYFKRVDDFFAQK
jgi:hypothetical protein